MDKPSFYEQKEKLIEEIKEKYPDIVAAVDASRDTCKMSGAMLEQSYIFLSNIRESLTDEEFAEFAKEFLSGDNLLRLSGKLEGQAKVYGGSAHDFNFSGDQARECIALDNLLKNQSMKHGGDYIKNGMQYARENIGDSSNLMDAFLKYIVCTNYQDLQCRTVVGNVGRIRGGERYECVLGDYQFAHVKVEFDTGTDYIEPDMLAARANMTGMKLGKKLLQYVMETVHEQFPDRSMKSTTVMRKNIPAIKLYKSMGGQFYVGGKPIENPYADTKNSCTVIFTKEKMEEVSQMEITPPELNWEPKSKQNEPTVLKQKEKTLSSLKAESAELSEQLAMIENNKQNQDISE